MVAVGLAERGKPREIGFTHYLICLLMGGPFFLWMGPARRKRRVAKRLQPGGL